MASIKQRIILSVALVAAVLAIGASARDLVVGRRQWGDVLYSVQQVNVRARYGSVVTDRKSCFVSRGNITYIQALDRGYYGKGGYAQIISGGVGQKYVDVTFWSQRGQSLNFTLNVYARK